MDDRDELAGGDTLPSGPSKPAGEASDPLASTAAGSIGAPAAARAGELAVGRKIDRFTIEGRLGAGAMGVVYLAHDPELDRRIALKLIRGSGEGLHARLYREAQALARVAHPNVVVVHEVGTHEGQVFVAMELVRGETLRGWLARRPGLPEVLRILGEAGRGLAAAHAAGLVHRDFKPDNVLIGEDGRARVTDFGLARTNADDDLEGAARMGSPAAMSPLYQSLTQTGMMVGTPVYASPEQLAGERVGPASDQFSFCITAYEAMYGKRPFEASNLADLMARVTAGTIAPPPGGHRVPKPIDRALRRGLHPDPQQRYPSMDALLGQLVLRHSKRRAIAIGGGIAVVGLAAGIALAARGGGGGGGAALASCTEAGELVEAVWNRGAGERMREAFGGHAQAAAIHGRIGKQLDRYARDWSAARVTACRDAQIDGDQRRIRCLDHALDVLRGVVEDLSRPNTSPEIGPMLVGNLEPVALCRHAVEEPDAASRELVRKARIEILYARTAWIRNDRPAAKRTLRVLLAKPEAVRYPPLQAEIHAALGSLAMLESDPATAEQHLRTAVQIAETAGDDRNKALAGLELVDALVAREQIEAAAIAADQAEATLKRLGGDPASEARLLVRRARIAVARGKPADAAALLERAIELAEASGLEASSEATMELARVQATLGNADRANELLDQAFQTLAPDAGDVEHGKAFVAYRTCEKAPHTGDLERALRQCTDAVARMKAARGGDDPFVAPALLALALTQELREEYAAARESYLRAVAIFEKLGMLKQAPGAIEGAGRTSQELRDWPAAIAHYRRAAEIYRSIDGDGVERVVFARSGLGRALLEHGEQAPAIAELEWALPRLETLKVVPRNSLAGARISLADALWRRNGRGDRARARVLADAAREDAAAHRAKFQDDADPLNPVYRRRAAQLAARVEAWHAGHR